MRVDGDLITLETAAGIKEMEGFSMCKVLTKTLSNNGWLLLWKVTWLAMEPKGDSWLEGAGTGGRDAGMTRDAWSTVTPNLGSDPTVGVGKVSV